MLHRITWWATWSVDIYCSFKRFSISYCISWEYSDPYCSSQRVFTSSAVQTLASLSCSQWSLLWSYFVAPLCYPYYVYREWTLDYVSLRISCGLCNGQYFLWSVCVDTDCNKREQTSRSVVETEIQTSCNFKANLHDRYYVLGCVHHHFSNAILESPNYLVVRYHSYISVSSNLHLLLHKGIPHPPSSSKSNTRPRSSTEPNKSTEYSAIQKGSVHCNMAATDAGRLLSTL